MKATKEVQDAKEQLAKNEQIKAAAKKRQEKLEDIAAKKRIQEKIAADKEERRLRAEKVKAEREGRIALPESPVAAAPAALKPAATHTEARLRLQMASGTTMKTYPADTTLFEVAQAIEAENGIPVTSFTMTYPKKTFSGGADLGMTLKEAGLVPSAVLIVT
jgi:UBX domain-containing protein 1/4